MRRNNIRGAALRIEWLCVAAVLFASPVFAQNRAENLRSEFAQESNAVRKARLMPRLGEAEFQEIAEAFRSGRLEDAEAGLQQYVAQIHECAKGLDALRIDAEKHPKGFKQLQISLRESLRRLDRLMEGLTPGEHVPFAALRKQMDEVNEHLFHELFPRRPSGSVPATTPNK